MSDRLEDPREPMRFDLRPEDLQLIQAAIALGDWLAAYRDVTPEQVATIRALQAALRRLPEDSPDVLDVEYGFSVRTGDGWDVERPPESWSGIWHEWSVSLWRHHPGEPGILEFGKSVGAHPELDDVEAVAQEFRFYRVAGDQNHGVGDHQEWIDEVRDPLALLPSGGEFLVETDARMTEADDE